MSGRISGEKKKFKGITKNVKKTKKLGEYVTFRNWDPSKGEKHFDGKISNHVFRNKGHEMCLQKVNNFAFNGFVNKRKN